MVVMSGNAAWHIRQSLRDKLTLSLSAELHSAGCHKRKQGCLYQLSESCHDYETCLMVNYLRNNFGN